MKVVADVASISSMLVWRDKTFGLYHWLCALLRISWLELQSLIHLSLKRRKDSLRLCKVSCSNDFFSSFLDLLIFQLNWITKNIYFGCRHTLQYFLLSLHSFTFTLLNSWRNKSNPYNFIAHSIELSRLWLPLSLVLCEFHMSRKFTLFLPSYPFQCSDFSFILFSKIGEQWPAILH